MYLIAVVPRLPACSVTAVKYPGVAQLVARLVRDQEAVGSNPVTRTKNSPKLAGFGEFL